MRRPRRALGVALLLVATITGAWAVRYARPGESARWEEVRSEPFLRRIGARGEVRSADAIIAGCPKIAETWEFTITFIADEGRQVAVGERLLAFDDRKLRERLEVRSSELDKARTELEKERLKLEDEYDARVLALAEARAEQARVERELDVPVVLRAGLEIEKLKIDSRLAARRLDLARRALELQRKVKELRLSVAEQEIRELEQEVTRIRRDLSRMRVTAKRAGYVVHVADWRGEKPEVGQSVWRGRPLLEVADLSRMQVSAEVAEADAAFVREGQRVEIRLDAAPDRLFPGRIRRLGRLFRTRSNDVPTKVFDAIVDIESPDEELMRPGMATSVEILAVTPGPVIHVPEAAVTVDAGIHRVVVRRQGRPRPEPVRVELGGRWNGRVIVTSGLRPGDLVRVDRHED